MAIDKKRKAMRDEDYDTRDDGTFNGDVDPKIIGYEVGEKFDKAGLPNPYIEDHDQIDKDNDDRDGRGLPTTFAVSSTPAKTTLVK